ncbi:hypothetical protein MVEN_00836700 [Mycena venus]|uniref:Uncharacterized protein n=1 Tax=Mycena venus TaxID=2733690 RepID=A0A8H6YGM1_9AGAR|nr:hypothetical protein MVEN_00836700 [Mycena venus]
MFLQYSSPVVRRVQDSPATRSEPLVDEPPFADDDAQPLRPLTSLKWPYVPEESAYPDPLKRVDPKSLQTQQYEAIGPPSLFHISYFIIYFTPQQPPPAIRTTLAAYANLPVLLTSIDKMHGPDREHALRCALGVAAPEITSTHGGGEPNKDVLALRAPAEAAVRGGKEGALGLNWGG